MQAKLLTKHLKVGCQQTVDTIQSKSWKHKEHIMLKKLTIQSTISDFSAIIAKWSFDYNKFISVLIFLKNCFGIKGIIILFVFVGIADIDSRCFGTICDCYPTRPYKAFHSHNSFGNCFRTFTDCFIELFRSDAFYRPFLAIQNHIFKLWLRRVY